MIRWEMSSHRGLWSLIESTEHIWEELFLSQCNLIAVNERSFPVWFFIPLVGDGNHLKFRDQKCVSVESQAQVFNQKLCCGRWPLLWLSPGLPHTNTDIILTISPLQTRDRTDGQCCANESFRVCLQDNDVKTKCFFFFK